MALIRTALLAALIYGAYLVAFPDWGRNTLYQGTVPFFIAGGVVGVALLKKMLDIGEGGLKFVLEGAFLVAVALFLGYTLPQKNGKPPPLTQWAQGVRPHRDDARRGLERLHVDPNGAVGLIVLHVFPN